MCAGVFTTGRDMQCLCCAQLDTHIREDHTQLFMPEAAKKKKAEMIFQVAHLNPVPGHIGYDKTLE